MRLKVTTTAFLILGLLLLAGWPWIVGQQPPKGDLQATREYAARFGIYIIMILLVWFTTALLAVIVARRARKELREEAMQNLQELLEESLKDHGKPKP